MLHDVKRRAFLAAAATMPLARPALVRAQGAPVRIGLLSDVGGPYRNVGGPGGRVAVQMAVEDFGGNVLGRPIEVEQADIQNKPDIANARAREWIDAGFNVLMDGGATSSGLAVQQVATEKKVIYLGNGPSAADQTGKFCSPVAFHFWANTYSLSKGTATVLTKAGGTSWFFITADYQFGYSLQEGAERFVRQAGGQVLGSAKAPLGTTDFSAMLVQARASGAKVVAFANAGADLQNCIKQASEFGVVKGGQSLATLLMFVTDVVALGQDVCEGLVLTNSFYWDLTPKTRAWSEQFIARTGQPPTMVQAANYSAATHWLKAVTASKSLDGSIVAKTMRQTPVNDFFHDNTPISANGQLQETMHIWRVKGSAKAKGKYDFYEPVGDIPGTEAFIPVAESGCTTVDG